MPGAFMICMAVLANGVEIIILIISLFWWFCFYCKIDEFLIFGCRSCSDLYCSAMSDGPLHQSLEFPSQSNLPVFDARNSGVPEPEIESTNEDTSEEYNDSNYWKSNLIDEELENEILKDLE